MKLEEITKISMGGLAEVGRISLTDLLRIAKSPIRDNDAHIRAAIDWTVAAQDATPDGGF